MKKSKTKPKKKQHTAKIILVLVAMISTGTALGVTIYSVTLGTLKSTVRQEAAPARILPDSKEETRDWKIYADNEFWYQVKYPTDWHMNGTPAREYGPKRSSHALFTSSDGNNDIKLEVFNKDADVNEYRKMKKAGEAFIKTDGENIFVLHFTSGLEKGERRDNLEKVLKRMGSTFKFIEGDDKKLINGCKEQVNARKFHACFLDLGKERDENFCDRVDDRGRAYCYAGVGFAKNDLRTCDGLSDGEIFCRGLIGGLKEDKSVCERIKDYSCAQGLAITLPEIDNEFCEAFQDNWYKEDCYIEKALKEKDSEICKNKVKVAGAKEDCFRDLAVETQDPDICKNISQGPCRQFYWAGRDYCYDKVALASGDPDVCEKSVCGGKGSCYTDVAIKLGDITLCSKFNLENAKLWPNPNCYETLAKSVNDVKVCEELKDTEAKDFCYSGIGRKFKDKDICDKVIETETKNWCYQAIEK